MIASRGLYSSVTLGKLYRAQAFFVEGTITVGETKQQGFAIIYKSEVIASGTKREMSIILNKLGIYGSDLTKVLDNFIVTIGRVEYGLSILSQEMIQFRKTLGAAAKHNGNIAGFEFLNKEGILERKVFTTLEKQEEWVALGFKKNFRPHAEEIGIKVLLEQEGILAKDVKAIYSELQPCILSGHECGSKIKSIFPNAKISYSFDYTNAISRKKAIIDRAKELDNFIK